MAQINACTQLSCEVGRAVGGPAALQLSPWTTETRSGCARATQRAGWKGRKTLESANPHPMLWQRGFMEMTKPSPGPRPERRGSVLKRDLVSSRFNGVSHRFHSSVTWWVGADPVRLHRGHESGDNRLIDGEVPPRGAEKPGWGSYGSLRDGAWCGDVHAAGGGNGATPAQQTLGITERQGTCCLRPGERSPRRPCRGTCRRRSHDPRCRVHSLKVDGSVSCLH